MLTIRRAQLAAFTPLADAELVRRMIDLVREHVSAPCVPPCAIETFVTESMARARQLGLSWEISLADFLLMELTYGAGFMHHPFLQPAVRELAEAGQPDVVFFTINTRVPPEVWQALRPA